MIVEVIGEMFNTFKSTLQVTKEQNTQYEYNQIKSQRNKITFFPPNGIITLQLVPATEPPLHRAGGKIHVVRKDYLEVKIKSDDRHTPKFYIPNDLTDVPHGRRRNEPIG